MIASKALRSVIFALVVDRKDLDLIDETQTLLIQSLQPEPMAVLPKPSSSQQPNKTTRKSKPRIVDLEGDESVQDIGAAAEIVDRRVQSSSSSTPAITIIPSIGESGRSNPSLVINVGSVQSSDSQDTDVSPAVVGQWQNQSTLNLVEMRQMLLDLSERNTALEQHKYSLEVQLENLQSTNKQLNNHVSSIQEQNNELAKYYHPNIVHE